MQKEKGILRVYVKGVSSIMGVYNRGFDLK